MRPEIEILPISYCLYSNSITASELSKPFVAIRGVDQAGFYGGAHGFENLNIF